VAGRELAAPGRSLVEGLDARLVAEPAPSKPRTAAADGIRRGLGTRRRAAALLCIAVALAAPVCAVTSIRRLRWRPAGGRAPPGVTFDDGPAPAPRRCWT
jgi:hypothetical protein